MLKNGLVQVYTGDGKGKTTAAFGAALRAAGHGLNVLIYQFLKPESLDIGERNAVKEGLSNITLQYLDIDWDMYRSFEDENILKKTKTVIKNVIKELSDKAAEKAYDMIILDEIVYCLYKGLASIDDIKTMIEGKNAQVELIFTGNGAPQELIDIADLVTEMKKVKHPFDKGIGARKAIEF